MLLFKRLASTQLDKRPSLLEVLNLLGQEASHHGFVCCVFNLIGPTQEKVLEGKERLFSVSEPLLLAHYIELSFKCFVQAPGLVLNLKLVFHFVVKGKLGLGLSKMLAVLGGLLDAKLQIVPLHAELFHHF